MKKIITRKIRENESMNDYIDNIKKEFPDFMDDFDDDNNMVSFDEIEGVIYIGPARQTIERLFDKKRTKKINVWVTDRVFEELKAVQIINGGVSANEAMNIIINEYMEKFRETEEYSLSMTLLDKINKK